MAEETDVQIDGTSGTSDGNDYSGLTEAVSHLVDIMHRGDLERLEVSQGDLHILLCARSTSPAVAPAPAAANGAAESAVAPNDAAAKSGPEHDAQPWHQIKSPMVGTFYEAPSPGEPPFVRPGDSVEVGQTVAIIEAMKIMNEIVADRNGIIEAVMVENGETVEFGHPLFRMRPA